MNLDSLGLRCQVKFGNIAKAVFAIVIATGLTKGVEAVPIAPSATGDNWALELTDSSKSSPPGSTLIFRGTVVNNTGFDLVIDAATLDLQIGVDPSLFSLDLDPLFLDTFGVIPTSGYSGPLFDVTWANGIPLDLGGLGTFELVVQSPASPTSLTVGFMAAVATPEPSSVLLLLMGGLIYFLCRRQLSAVGPSK